MPGECLAVVCVISLSFRTPWRNMSWSDSTFHPRGANAWAVSFQPDPGAPVQRSVSGALLSHSSNRDCNTGVTSPIFAKDFRLLLSGQIDPGYPEVDGDQHPTKGHPTPTQCLPKALMVPATKRNRGLAISSGMRTSTMENICDVLKIQADACRTRLKNSPTLY